MEEYLDSMEMALSELKRAEHSIYVSLRYARNVEIIEGIIERLVYSYESIFNAVYYFKLEEGKIEEKDTIKERIETILDLIDNENLNQASTFYDFIKHLKNQNSLIENRYRRYFGIIYFLEDSFVYMLDIDQMKEWLELLKKHFISAEDIILTEEEKTRGEFAK
ncbi:MAG: hypothetical protein ACOCP4_00040 [Candidatus Woesearchaeota archaeon]